MRRAPRLRCADVMGAGAGLMFHGYALNAAICYGLLALVFLASLISGMTLRGFDLIDRKTDPAAYWRTVRGWAVGWGAASLILVASFYLAKLK